MRAMLWKTLKKPHVKERHLEEKKALSPHETLPRKGDNGAEEWEVRDLGKS